ncbi:GrxA family glutaredoxin [Escherichia coli]|nr:GrxA family glutaredoxin [Escherichia coli]HCY2097960.1 GrxA family glutaredoxin [Escherichia coli]HCY2741024.1 GrxA family glutaredoxin [Escherichia coli]
MKTQPATGETYPKSDLFNKAYVDIRAEGITKEDLQQKAGKPVETVPQIFVDQQHIGGYTDFAAWVKENLDA